METPSTINYIVIIEDWQKRLAKVRSLCPYDNDPKRDALIYAQKDVWVEALADLQRVDDDISAGREEFERERTATEPRTYGFFESALVRILTGASPAEDERKVVRHFIAGQRLKESRRLQQDLGHLRDAVSKRYERVVKEYEQEFELVFNKAAILEEVL